MGQRAWESGAGQGSLKRGRACFKSGGGDKGRQLRRLGVRGYCGISGAATSAKTTAREAVLLEGGLGPVKERKPRPKYALVRQQLAGGAACFREPAPNLEKRGGSPPLNRTAEPGKGAQPAGRRGEVFAGSRVTTVNANGRRGGFAAT